MVLIGASPNTQTQDVLLALKCLVTPWAWRSDESVKDFETELSNYFNSQVITFDSARSSLFAILKAWEIGPGDEVILPSFICFVVANAIIATGAKPIYADISNNLNLDINDVKAKITNQTKAIIVPHMFGIPVDIPKLGEAVGDDIKIIEDIAHAFGGRFQGQELGTFGDAAIVSFGMDKIISTVRGGGAITKDIDLATKLKKIQKQATQLSSLELLRIAMHPIIWGIAQPLYSIGFRKLTLGKLILQISKILGLSGSITVKAKEEQANWPRNLPAKLSGLQARLGIAQLKRLSKFNAHRRQISQIYQSGLGLPKQDIPYLRYPILINNPTRISEIAKSLGIQLGRWYDNVLFTAPHNLLKYYYTEGETINTEKLVTKILNLPTGTNISAHQAQELIDQIKNYVEI